MPTRLEGRIARLLDLQTELRRSKLLLHNYNYALRHLHSKFIKGRHFYTLGDSITTQRLNLNELVQNLLDFILCLRLDFSL